MRTRTVTFLGLAAVIVILTGCESESTSGQRHEFTYSWWVTGEVFIVGVALALGGVFVAFNGWKYRSSKERGARVGFFVIGLMLALGLAPTTFLYRVAVDQNGFSIRSGVWGTSMRDMKFANLTRIRLISMQSGGGRGGSRTNYFLECDGKSGSVEQIPLHDGVWSVVAKAALPLIKENASRHGVDFVNDTSFRFPSR